MKTIYLIQTAFVAATSWAMSEDSWAMSEDSWDASENSWASSEDSWVTSDRPWGLFARVGDSHVPLSFPDPHGDDLLPLSYSKATQMPTQVFYYNDKATTAFGFVGVADDFLVHGPQVSATTLKLGSNKCFSAPSFFRCTFPGVQSQLIQTKHDSNCVPVEICLEKFDKDAGQAEEIPPQSEYYTPDEHVPHTLFVADGSSFSRVSVSSDGCTFQRAVSSLKPVRVYYKDHRLFTQDSVTRYLGFQNGVLRQTPTEYSAGSFSIHQSGKIVGTDFTLCETGTRFIHTLNGENEECQAVDVYLFPYDRSGEATIPQDAVPETEVYRPQEPPFPFVLFAKVNGTYHAVCGVRGLHGTDFESFTYGWPEPPLEFDLGVHALSTNTVNGGYASFQDGEFGLRYSSQQYPYSLDLDQTGRLQGKTFYSCLAHDDGTFTIHTTRLLDGFCLEVDMYFGKYNRETREYMEVSFGQPLPGNGTQADTVIL